ncbi:MAG TPA: hypothetical protein VFO93_15830 [Hymenobacter sp.]|uniref:hypothetical protein n=1 Tax=Hymenobacter sp. TaxID=1898978 RepID=UPI002D7E3182|nr:hypothetical protein [Hymenobacter sp.]HET9505012.1 hypothetical protein [Hymenobacter sp.]
MYVHVQKLPQGCLLTLHPGATSYRPLAQALRNILQGPAASVWVDCRHVRTLPAGVLRVLRRVAACLWQRGGHLVVCHLSATAHAGLAADAHQPLAASLLDARHYGLACPRPEAAEG